MKLIFVRHAEPDYKHDSLTLKGRREAELLSLRLAKLDVKDFYVSPLGRAQETARYTLDRMKRTAETLPWLAEFRGRSFDPEKDCFRIPWDYKPQCWMERPLLRDADRWVEDEWMASGTVPSIWDETREGLDALLARYGFNRQGKMYHAQDNQPDTIVLFCHFGIMAACIGYLTGISPVNLWHGFCAQPSSVTTLVTEERVRGEVAWRCMSWGDLSHLYVADEPYSTAALFPECYTGRDSTNPPEWDELGY